MKHQSRKYGQFLQSITGPRGRYGVSHCLRRIHRSAWASNRDVFDEHLIVFLESGLFTAQIGSQTFNLLPGEVLWIPPGCNRFFQGETESSFRIKVHASCKSKAVTPFPQAKVFRDMWDVQPLFRKITDEMICGRRNSYVLGGLALALMADVLASESDPSEFGARVFTHWQRIRVLAYLDHHLHEKMGMKDLAVELNLSEVYTRRLFSATFGQSLRSWLKRARMQRAAELLEECPRGIKEIAKDVGVRDVVLFHRQFRDIFHCTPKQYREREFH